MFDCGVSNEIHIHKYTGTGYLQDAEERRDSDFDIGSRDFGDNFSPPDPDTMNSDEENGKLLCVQSCTSKLEIHHLCPPPMPALPRGGIPSGAKQPGEVSVCDHRLSEDTEPAAGEGCGRPGV